MDSQIIHISHDLPKANVSLLPAEAHKKTSWREKHLEGWRFGVTACALSSALVFFLNLGITIWSVNAYGRGEGGRQTIFSGSCNTARSLNRNLHLVINIFGTI